MQPKVRSEGVVQFDEFKCCDPDQGLPIERWNVHSQKSRKGSTGREEVPLLLDTTLERVKKGIFW